MQHSRQPLGLAFCWIASGRYAPRAAADARLGRCRTYTGCLTAWRQSADSLINQLKLETILSFLNIANPNTKATRKEFWVLLAVLALASFVLFYYAGLSFLTLMAYPEGAEIVRTLSFGIPCALLLLYLLIVSQCRRLNDLNQSKLWVLVNIVPIGTLILALYLGLAPAKQDTQRVAAA